MICLQTVERKDRLNGLTIFQMPYVFRASWPLTQRMWPDRIPVVSLINGCSSTTGNTTELANSLNSDQVRNFDKLSDCLKF